MENNKTSGILQEREEKKVEKKPKNWKLTKIKA